MTNTYSMKNLDNCLVNVTDLGNGYRITADSSMFMQLQRDDLLLRVYHDPDLNGGSYKGILLVPSLGLKHKSRLESMAESLPGRKKTLPYEERDYEFFEKLTNRLNQYDGVEIRNTAEDFLFYSRRLGLDTQLDSIDSHIRLNLWDQRKVPKESTKDYVGDTTAVMVGGRLAEIAGAVALFAAVRNPLIGGRVVGLYVLLEFGLSVAFSLDPKEHGLSSNGPLYSFGEFLTRELYLEHKMKGNNYMINEFKKRFGVLDHITGQHQNFQKAQAKKKVDYASWALFGMADLPQHAPGLTITHMSDSEQQVLDLFAYLVSDEDEPLKPDLKD